MTIYLSKKMWRLYALKIGLAMATLTGPILVSAESLNLPTDIPITEEQIFTPARGLTMDEVLKSFGAPLERKGAVGNPPITRWIYDDYVVHFEGRYVIHSVIPK